MEPDNCGGCGVHCSDGTVCWYDICVLAYACTANDDGATCQLSPGASGGCCSGSCVDLSSDAANCGECGATCAASTPCVNGTCSTTQPTTCGADGSICTVVSGALWTCCGEACVDLWADPANCGACGNACAGGEGCFSGTCAVTTPCGTNGDFCVIDGGGAGTCCAGRCSGMNDPDNCAACGARCALGGSCQASYKQVWFAQCVTDGGASLSCTQDADCGGGLACAGGYCTAPLCDAGTASCALAEDGGVALGICCGDICVDPDHDPENCMHCGNTCPPGQVCGDRVDGCRDPSSGNYFNCGPVGVCPRGSFCETGTCAPPTCGPGSEGNYCSFGPLKYFIGICCGGACIDEEFDPLNCGGCGLSCSSGRCNDFVCVAVTQSCLQSCGSGTICAGTRCVGSICQGDQVFCLANDGTVGDCCLSGACADLADDPLNCGACGIVCPTGATCQNGLCNGLAACGPGHANSYCNPDAGLSFLCCAGVGCIDTSSDPSNCGVCNAACSPGQNCNAGACG
jgi:hypothetical protein